MNGSYLKFSKESITCTTPGSFSYSSRVIVAISDCKASDIFMHPFLKSFLSVYLLNYTINGVDNAMI